MVDVKDLVTRYNAVWNEPDPARRRAQIAALWVPGGEHFMRERHACGYDELEQRIEGSYNKSVRDGGNIFVLCGNEERSQDIVKFHWRMVRQGGTETIALGMDVLLLAEDGRIRTDYQFVEPGPLV